MKTCLCCVATIRLRPQQCWTIMQQHQRIIDWGWWGLVHLGTSMVDVLKEFLDCPVCFTSIQCSFNCCFSVPTTRLAQHACCIFLFLFSVFCWSQPSISAHQKHPMMHLVHTFGHHWFHVHFLKCALLRLLATFHFFWCAALLRLLLVFHSPYQLLCLLCLCPLLSHMSKKLRHREVTLLCKVLSAFLVLLYGFFRPVIIFFGVFSRINLRCLCCKTLGFLQNCIKVIQCWLLNNLNALLKFLKVCFQFLLATLTSLNSKLKGSVSRDNYFVFKRSRFVSIPQVNPKIGCQNSPLDLNGLKFLAFSKFLILAFIADFFRGIMWISEIWKCELSASDGVQVNIAVA